MGPEKVYTQREVDELLITQRDQLEARHFEEKTEEVLDHINKRLDESNNYKATIGKDLKDVKEKIHEMETNRLTEVEQTKKNLVAQQDRENRRKEWWRDWWIRGGIVGTILWELVNIYQASGGSVHDVIHGIVK